MTLTAPLVMLLAAVPAAVSAPAGPAPVSPRQVELHRSATYNMRYKWERWQHGVFPLARQAEILALQEVPDSLPPDTEPADGRHVGALTPMPNGFTVERYRWVNCRPPNPQSPCIIYRIVTQRRNRSIAIVVNQPDDDVVAVNVVPPQAPEDDAKPALGIQLSDGTWFYSVHARNRVGVRQDNDAPDLVAAIDRVAGAHWAVLGDFNRTPDSWERRQLAPGIGINRTDLATYPVPAPRSELDYMVYRGLSSLAAYSAHRLTYVDGSDHYPVGFWYSPNGNVEYPCDPGDAQLRAARARCAPKTAIVSMGDSYISGEAGRWAGNANTTPAGTDWGTDRAATNCVNETRCQTDLDRVYGLTSYAEGGNRCDRSDTAPILAASYPFSEWRHFNLACSGATTDEISRPFSEKGQPAQIDQLKAVASAYRVAEIVVSIGGNDLGFEDIISSCARDFLLSPPFYSHYCKKGWGDQSTELDTVGNKVTRSLKDIQESMSEAGYAPWEYRLVVQNYPQPLPPGNAYRYPETNAARYGKGGCPFFDADTDWARDTIVTGMTRELQQAAERVGATFLDVQDALAGHELCNKNAQQATSANTAAQPLNSQSAEWVRWVSYLKFQSALWSSQGAKQEAIHPNFFGQLALGGCLTELGTRPASGFYSSWVCTNDGLHGIDGMQVHRA
ncbi:hypothetical protein AQI95_05480 [Streptomyces yokosukanensis]|uniref:Endonuclease/exonuclease/phosphatase domain-containing protein n=1 Tax=Streptomyces yokosukanensis TaxID=67386 RepID=A0A101PD17_9ACTN|nr:endonuclease/exonuclease/phosphatase family protein [Streptomyces yokosukanensis]KUN09285.1 hypothetical protein AQI95_05480 [Streptomyces yokosukanensis]